MLLILTTIALAIISATMLVRANDLGWRSGLKWHARRVGFILSGFSPVGIVLKLWLGADPVLYWCIFSVGIALVFVTTPYLPPWWKWISGKDGHPPVEADDRRGMPRGDRTTALDRRRDENP